MDLGVVVLWVFALIGALTVFSTIVGIIYTSFRSKYNPVDKVDEALREVEDDTDSD